MNQKSLKAVRRRRLEMRRMLKSSLLHTHESKHMILSPSHSPSRSPSSSSAISPPKRIKKEDNRGTNSNSSANSGSFSSASSPPSTADSNLTAVITQSTRISPSIKCSSYGSVCLIGRRREMEDTVTVAPGISPEYDFFAVYDGHGGKQVAETCRERMHLVLKGEVERRGSEPLDLRWREVMEDCFRKMDAEVLEIADEGSTAEKTIGSTAVVAVVAADSIVVANCGDSRAVLCRDGVTLPLSSDHKPNRADEMERVEAAGGRVIDWDGFRVLGVLATSRSIGDQYLKPFVTSEPEVTVTERMEKDEFLILASDGLWDVVSSEVACGLTRMCLKDRAGDGGAVAATALAELALSRGSTDNVSVVVVVL